jgi:uncharacterized iron-regulated membrane protein
MSPWLISTSINKTASTCSSYFLTGPKQLRATIRWLHTWGGIILGALVSVIFLTGSVITFRQEAEKARWPHTTVPPQGSRKWSLDAVAREISRSQQGSWITRVRFPVNPRDPYVFQIKSADLQTHRMAVDASTGQILGEEEKIIWLDWMVDLHRNLLAGRPGRQAIGGVGIVGLTLSVTALLLWALTGGSWRAWVKIRRNSGSRRFNFDLHRVSGLWALVFVAALSFTGMALSYPQALRDAWERLTGQPASMRPPILPQTPNHPWRSLEEYLASSRVAMSDGEPIEMRFPELPTTAVYLRLRRAGDLSSTGSNRVYLDPASARALSVERASDWPFGVQLFQAFAPIHYGPFGGLPVKILWSFLGVTPSLLFVTGLLVWWSPGKQKARRTAGAKPGSGEVLREDDSLAEPVTR